METIYEIYDQIVGHLPLIIGGLAVLAALVLLGVPMVIKGARRWANYAGGHHFTKPSEWLKKQPRSLFKAKSSLLANAGLRELYTPSSRYIRDLNEGEKAGKASEVFLSPYGRAVRASIKANRGSARGKKLEARRQIRELAKLVEVLPLGEEDPAEHYRIVLQLDGHDPAEIKRLEGKIAAQLGLAEIRRAQGRGGFSYTFEAHTNAPIDPLTTETHGAEFYKEHKAKTPFSLPLAVKESGQPWALPLHHTLIIGATGSGKSSPLNGTIFQLVPYIEQGLVQLYGIDPKSSELRPYQESALFEDVVYTDEDAAEMVASIAKMMDARARGKKVDLQNADLGRSMKPTKREPIIILMIDELLSLLVSLKQKRDRGTEAELTRILAMGRSLNIFVIGAAQEGDRELLGRMRNNFANKIILRQESAYMNDLFLGEGATENGYDSTAIPVATRANGYRTAGIGFVKEETGNPVRVRFAYADDAAISALIGAHLRDEHEDAADELAALLGSIHTP